MLSVPASQLDILTTGSFDSERDVEKMVTAAKLLRETLTMQFPGGMGLMSAIDEKLDEFREKRQRFSARIADHIEKIVESEMDACLNDKTRLSKKGEFRLFSHAHVHARLARLQVFYFFQVKSKTATNKKKPKKKNQNKPSLSQTGLLQSMRTSSWQSKRRTAKTWAVSTNVNSRSFSRRSNKVSQPLLQARTMMPKVAPK